VSGPEIQCAGRVLTCHSGQAEAINNINEVSEGICTDFLKSVLELNLPKTSGKKSKVVLGVTDKNLAGAIKAEFPGLECETGDTNQVVADVIRGIRLHAEKLIEGLNAGGDPLRIDIDREGVAASTWR